MIKYFTLLLLLCTGSLLLNAQDYAFTTTAQGVKDVSPNSWFTTATVSKLKESNPISFWRGKSSADKLANAQRAFDRYRGGMPEFAPTNLGKYVATAVKVRQKRLRTTVCKTLTNKDQVCYDKATNLLVVSDPQKKLVALFRPKEGQVFYDKVLSSPAYTYLEATPQNELASGPASTTRRGRTSASSSSVNTRGTGRSPGRSPSPTTRKASEEVAQKDGYEEVSLTQNDNENHVPFAAPREVSGGKPLPGGLQFSQAEGDALVRQAATFRPIGIKDDYGYIGLEPVAVPSDGGSRPARGASRGSGTAPRNNRGRAAVRSAPAQTTVKDVRTVRTYLNQADPDRWVARPPSTAAAVGQQYYAHSQAKGDLTGVTNFKQFTAVSLGLLYDMNYKTRRGYVNTDGDMLILDGPSGLVGLYDYRGRIIQVSFDTVSAWAGFRAGERENNGDQRLDLTPPKAAIDNGLTPAVAPMVDGLPGAYKTYALFFIYGEENTRGLKNTHRTRYLGPEDRRRYEVFVNKQGLLTNAEGELIDTRNAITTLEDDIPGAAITVMDPNGRIYLNPFPLVAEFHHSTFLSGAPAAFAGEMVVENGVLKLINNRSGHYRPESDACLSLQDQLTARGVDFARVNVRYASER